MRTVLQQAPTRGVEVGASKVVGQEFPGRVELNERKNTYASFSERLKEFVRRIQKL